MYSNVSSVPSLVWVCGLWFYRTCILMRITVYKSAAVPRRISGSGETGANHFPSKLALLVRAFLDFMVMDQL